MEERVDVVVDPSSAKRGLDVLVDSFKRVYAGATQAESGVQKLFDTMSSGVKKFESGVLTLRNILLGVGTVVASFKQLSNEIIRFQSFIATMTVSVGTVEKARESYSNLMAMADKLGISITSLQHNYAQLSAAASNAGIQTKVLEDIFESFSTAARVLHLNGQETRLMFYALTQMMSKGVVSMEELRRQLGEKLPGAMQIAAQSVNATMDEFEQAVRRGIVDSAKFMPIFAQEVRRTFSPGLAFSINALDAEINRLTNSLQKMVIVFYDLGVADSFARIIREINRIMSDPDIAKAFAEGIKGVADKIEEFLKTISPQRVKEFVETFANAMKTVANVLASENGPVAMMAKLAKYAGIFLAAWAVAKGVTLGAAVGTAVPGIGTATGAVVGGGTALVGVLEANKALNETKAGPNMNGPTSSGKINYGPEGYLRDLAAGWEAAVADAQRPVYTLQDALRDTEEKRNALKAFIEQLKEKTLRTNEDDNAYDALRAKALDLNKYVKDDKLFQTANAMINAMEARGVEYQPLIQRLSGMIDRQNRETPDTIDREVERMATKYPKATTQITEARDLASQFRSQYYAKINKDQTLFNDKQDELIRKIREEGKLYGDQIALLDMTDNQREQALRRLEMEKQLEVDIFQLREEAFRNRRQFDEDGFRARGKAAIDATISDLQRLQEASRSAEHGLKSALIAYVDSATNAALQVSRFVTNSFQRMEDALVSFVTTGKFQFRDFANSVIADMARIVIQRTITGPLADAFLSYMGWGSGGGAKPTPGSEGAGDLATTLATTAANGGIRTPFGLMAYEAFSNGGIATRPTISIFGEGRMNEAYVPLPDGKRIPVALTGGMLQPATDVTINVINQTNNKVTAKQSQPKMQGGRVVVDLLLQELSTNADAGDRLKQILGDRVRGYSA